MPAMVRITASPAAQLSGLPPTVVPWAPVASRSAAVPNARQAPSGRPPPRPWARVTKSGAIPSLWWWNQYPVRPRAVCTSSSTSNAPVAVQIVRAAAR